MHVEMNFRLENVHVVDVIYIACSRLLIRKDLNSFCLFFCFRGRRFNVRLINPID